MRLVNDECVLHGAGVFSFATNDSNDFPGMTNVKFDIL